MTTLVTILGFLLRLIGLVEAAEKLLAAHQANRAQQAAKSAEKAMADEDSRQLDIAAGPDRSPDNIIDLMQRGQD